ncbi:unnamed protein product [Malus baccata var. baccata]
MVESPEQQHPKKAFGWAARDSSGVLSPFKFSRRETGKNDVTFKVLYCGICHTDLDMIKNEWGNSTYPLLPGHEIVGVVTEVGIKVEKFKVGDHVGVGYMAGSCQSCDSCSTNAENYCPKMIVTFGDIYHDGTPTYGGYSDIMVANDPLRYFGLDKPGMHVGVVGVGGLGHVALKFAKAMGLKVTMISTSPKKKEEAIENLGADSFLISHDDGQMQGAVGTMDGIIDTVSAVHPLLPLVGLLKSNGKIVLLGVPDKPLQLPVFPLLMGRKIIAGSSIGGMKETQEMFDFAAKHNITANVEVISVDYANTAMERLLKGDIRYRFVIDIGNTLHV